VRVISLNLNGIRSASSKGFFPWLAKQGANIVCLQELKAQANDLTAEMNSPPNYHGAFHFSERKGYSGVALYSRKQPQTVRSGIGNKTFDAEGRFLRADFADYSVISLYLPSGSSGPERQAAKFAFMKTFFPKLKALVKEKREMIICGDWNIAHREIDLKNWRANRKNSGFLPEERAWLTQVFDELGWVDVFRTLNNEPEQYTWWSNRGQAWAKNVGWRIDYQFATPGIAAQAKAVSIYKDERFSDHAPLIIDYEVAS
jgi:exodeoxyribonuclease III